MHIPVLPEETIETLNPQQGETVLDGTLGAAGHATKFIESIDPGTFIGMDLSEEALEISKEKLVELKESRGWETQLVFIRENFKNTREVIEEESLERPDILFLDLGLSSNQTKGSKGFSYQEDEPLVMRYDEDVSGFTAARLLNEYSEKQLAEIIKEYGEERFADRIAHQIAEKRREEKLRTTSQVVEAIEEALPFNYSPDKHPAKRSFQAIRIYVNEELKNLKKVLSDLEEIMKPGGRVGIISYHSLEDRIVKENFEELINLGKAKKIEDLITPTEKEVRRNPRSRSAKLRTIKFENNQQLRG